LRARRSTPIGVAIALLASLVLAGCGPTVEPSDAPRTTPSPSIAQSPPSPPPTSFPPALETPVPTPSSTIPTIESAEPAPYLPPPCGEADPTCSSLNVRLHQDIDYAGPVPCGVVRIQCLLRVDAFALEGGSKRPIVVMIPGGPLPPGNRETLWPLARYVAGRGAVVFTADYRSSPEYGGGYPMTFSDVACAIRFARSRGAELGGDPSRVTLVAHSFGGFPATVLTLGSRDYATDHTACVAVTGDGRPQAFAGVAGIYTLDRIGQDFLATFLGGDRSTAPAAWAAADAASLAKSGSGRAPVRLIVGAEDFIAPMAAAEVLATILRDEDREVVVSLIPDGTHDSVLRNAVTVDVISQLASDGQ
jgi:acetyl esterase/lipase